MTVSLYKPRHRANVTPDGAGNVPCTAPAPPTICGKWDADGRPCPRHFPITYAEAYPFHATDSIGKAEWRKIRAGVR